ncbi:hypothetical protein HDU77_011605 [Chytriomyces hyalinus]|nr:hypothetical protein HDU77_011605 [Chytriomyces hyalinus]
MLLNTVASVAIVLAPAFTNAAPLNATAITESPREWCFIDTQFACTSAPTASDLPNNQVPWCFVDANRACLVDETLAVLAMQETSISTGNPLARRSPFYCWFKPNTCWGYLKRDSETIEETKRDESASLARRSPFYCWFKPNTCWGYLKRDSEVATTESNEVAPVAKTQHSWCFIDTQFACTSALSNDAAPGATAPWCFMDENKECLVDETLAVLAGGSASLARRSPFYCWFKPNTCWGYLKRDSEMLIETAEQAKRDSVTVAKRSPFYCWFKPNTCWGYLKRDQDSA